MASDRHKFQDTVEVTVEQKVHDQYFIVVQLIRELQDKLGKEETSEIVKPLFERMFVEWGREEGRRNNIDSLEAFAEYDDRAFTRTNTHEVQELTSTKYLSHVTECVFARVLRAMDAAEIGYDILCSADFACYRAFNPRLKLTRTMTLMQGDPYCDFLLTWEE